MSLSSPLLGVLEFFAISNNIAMSIFRQLALHTSVSNTVLLITKAG